MRRADAVRLQEQAKQAEALKVQLEAERAAAAKAAEEAEQEAKRKAEREENLRVKMMAAEMAADEDDGDLSALNGTLVDDFDDELFDVGEPVDAAAQGKDGLENLNVDSPAFGGPPISKNSIFARPGMENKRIKIVSAGNKAKGAAQAQSASAAQGASAAQSATQAKSATKAQSAAAASSASRPGFTSINMQKETIDLSSDSEPDAALNRDASEPAAAETQQKPAIRNRGRPSRGGMTASAGSARGASSSAGPKRGRGRPRGRPARRSSGA